MGYVRYHVILPSYLGIMDRLGRLEGVPEPRDMDASEKERVMGPRSCTSILSSALARLSEHNLIFNHKIYIVVSIYST